MSNVCFFFPQRAASAMLSFADAQWPPVCASRRAGSALPACFKYRFLRFTRDTLSEGDDVLALFSQSSLPQWNHNAIVVGSHFGYEREKKKKKKSGSDR